MSSKQPDYFSFLIRIWRVSDNTNSLTTDKKPIWRASIEDPHTGEQRGFADLEELFDFLWEQTGGIAAAEEREETCPT